MGSPSHSWGGGVELDDLTGPFVKNHFDVTSSTMVFVTADDAVIRPGALIRREPTVIPRFDERALIDAIRADQRGETTFPEFVEATFAAGVFRYEVDTAARTCSYFGTHGEQYVEEYPAVELAPAPTTP